MQMQTFSPHALAQAAMRVLRYGYFAPLQAAWLTTRRPGGYIRPFGGRKTLYIWEAIEQDMAKYSRLGGHAIPMANGGALHA